MHRTEAPTIRDVSESTVTIVDVSVVVPTRNRARSLNETLGSLSTALSSGAASAEVVVVDNGSTDDTQGVVEASRGAFGDVDVTYVFEPVPGLLSGRHRGYFASRGDILVFIDDDVLVSATWLSAIVEAFGDPAVDLVGGRCLPRYESELPEWIGGYWTESDEGRWCTWLSLLDLGPTARKVDANFVWGLNFAIRRSALDALGGFHPDNMPKAWQHYQGDGETGLTRKANERGVTALYEPEALLFHVIPSSRLTVTYFEERAIYQGVCDSFTATRDAGSSAAASSDMPPVGPTASGSTTLRPDEIRRRIREAYHAGYRFHQEAVAAYPRLLDWVLRDTYWDYALPDLERS